MYFKHQVMQNEMAPGSALHYSYWIINTDSNIQQLRFGRVGAIFNYIIYGFVVESTKMHQWYHVN